MAMFVVDASAALPWYFEDESTLWTDGLLNRLLSGDRIVVPAHWPTEMSNGMLMAFRRGRIQAGSSERFWEELSALPIEIEPPLSPAQAKAVLALAVRHGLTVYDAVYLELAKRKGLALATLDADLAKAAAEESVSLLQ
jgi:predicted nucleic acid-binding protein